MQEMDAAPAPYHLQGLEKGQHKVQVAEFHFGPFFVEGLDFLLGLDSSTGLARTKWAAPVRETTYPSPRSGKPGSPKQ